MVFFVLKSTISFKLPVLSLFSKFDCGPYIVFITEVSLTEVSFLWSSCLSLTSYCATLHFWLHVGMSIFDFWLVLPIVTLIYLPSWAVVLQGSCSYTCCFSFESPPVLFYLVGITLKDPCLYLLHWFLFFILWGGFRDIM